MECLKCEREMEEVEYHSETREGAWTSEKFDCPHCGATHVEETKDNGTGTIDLVDEN